MPSRPTLLGWIPNSWADAGTRLGLATSAAPAPVSTAELNNYEFQLVNPTAKQSDEALVDVRIVHKPTGRPIADAIIFARRIDMAPEGMPTMTAPLEPLPAQDPGTYRFRTNLMMEGGWQLSLAAKIQGEIGTVQNRLVLKAVP